MSPRCSGTSTAWRSFSPKARRSCGRTSRRTRRPRSRAGTAPGEAAVALARQLSDTPGMELRGLMGYEGPAAGIEERERREAMAKQALDRLLSTVPLFKEAGFPTDIVSAGSTGTYDMTGRMDGVTEIQAGSYVLMDTAYGKEGLPLEQAFWVIGTVLSRPSP